MKKTTVLLLVLAAALGCLFARFRLWWNEA